METRRTHPKSEEWVLIKDGISEAFEKGYKGKWTLDHYHQIGKLIKVAIITTSEPFLDYVVTCELPHVPKGYLEFPSTCVERTRGDIPEGWFPANMPPPTRTDGYYINVYIGIQENQLPILVQWIKDAWMVYSSSKIVEIPVDIIAYQLLPNWPKKKPKQKEGT